MAQESKTQDTTVEKVDINIDELFAAAPDADAIVTPETKKPKSIFSKKEEVDLDFTEKPEVKAEEPAVEESDTEEPKAEEAKKEPKAEEKKEKTTATLDDVLDSLDEEARE